MNPVILADNAFLDGTPTATDTAAGYDVLNIRDLKPFTAWKAASSGTKYLTVNCAKARWADTLAYAFGNLRAAAALVSVEYSHDGSTWYEILSPFQFVSDRPRMITFTKTRAQYWRVKIVTASTAAQVGELMLGERIEFPYPPITPFRPGTEGIEAETTRSKTGNPLGSVVRYKPISVRPKFADISRSWVDTYFRPFWEDWGSNLSHFFWAWDLYAQPWAVEFVKFEDGYEFAPDASISDRYDGFELAMEGVRSTAARPAFLEWWYAEGLTLFAPFDDPNDPLKLHVGNGALSMARAGVATYLDPVSGLIKSASANTLRIEAGGALIEGARTNALTYSEQFDNAIWSKTGLVTSGMANVAAAPDGAATADQIIEDSANAPHFLAETVAPADSTDYVFSVYIKKKAGRDWCFIFGRKKNGTDCGRYFNLATGAKGAIYTSAPLSDGIEAAPNGYWRIWIRFNSGTGASGPLVLAGLASADGVSSYQGDGASGQYIWGAQFEAGDFPSSYIPTSSASVTRNSDVLTIGSSGNVLTSKGGVAFTADSEMETPANHHMLLNLSTGGGSYIAKSTNGLAIYEGGGFHDGLSVWNTRLERRGVVTWNGTSHRYYLNGDAAVGSTGTGVWGVGTVLIGGFATSAYDAYFFFGHIKDLRIFNRALTDAEMKLLAA